VRENRLHGLMRGRRWTAARPANLRAGNGKSLAYSTALPRSRQATLVEQARMTGGARGTALCGFHFPREVACGARVEVRPAGPDPRRRLKAGRCGIKVGLAAGSAAAGDGRGVVEAKPGGAAPLCVKAERQDKSKKSDPGRCRGNMTN